MASWLIATWQEAVERSKNNYLSELVNTFRIERTILNSQEPPGPPDNLLVLVAHLADRENISICDFGGATGYVGQAVLSYVPNANYTVVENETLVALATRRLNTHVKFVTSIPAACDIFYCGGTLQFLEHPLEIWKQALSSTRLACILVRNSFSERAIICLMRANLFDNGHGAIPAGYRNQKVFYPHQTVPESAINRVGQCARIFPGAAFSAERRRVALRQ